MTIPSLKLLLLTAAIAPFWCCQAPTPMTFDQPVEYTLQLDSSLLSVSVVADSLLVPWELVWGPDDWIWVSEEFGRISRVNPQTGEKKTLLHLPIGARPEGAQGMVVHPNPDAFPYVYIHYKQIKADSVRYNILARYTYADDTLVAPKIIMELVAGSSHTGSRLAFHDQNHILWATGDQASHTAPQDMNNLNGKVLRMDLEGKIPADNPFPNSYVYAAGFRNMQGMVVSDKQHIYVSEHGDATDDELNHILPGANYGFPLIVGPVDNELEQKEALRLKAIAPLHAWTPTIAPAGIDYYSAKAIPEWTNSLLVTMLKGQGLRVLKLNQQGDKVVHEELFLEKKYGRIRDICVSPQGDVYLATSNHDWNPMTSPHAKDDRIVRIAKTNKQHPAAPLLKGILPADQKEVKTGLALYQTYCFSCHKQDGKGIDQVFPSLLSSAVVQDHSKFLNLLLDGKKGAVYSMPSFNFLSKEDLNTIIDYVHNNLAQPAQVKR